MTALPANSTFLPVLDDLLSPDFRAVSLPGQTPQTPAQTPGGPPPHFPPESHKGQLTSREMTYSNYGGLSMSSSIHSTGGGGEREKPAPAAAATKIQRWWKRRKSVPDLGAERAKHAIRHSRTEEHVRYLENEVCRLKSALNAERKLRSLQVEAIRSLWTQVQKVSSATTPGGGPGGDHVMSQSMPNGIPCGVPDSCSCAKEIQTMKDSFASEMAAMRAMIDQLKGTGDEKERQRRPLTLDLSGGKGGEGESGPGLQGYADQMASSIIEDAIPEDDKEEEKEA